AGHVGVRKLVDDGDLRATAEDRLGVHLLEAGAAVLDDRARHHLEAVDERDRLFAAVRLEVADDDVDALPLQLARLGEHLVGLADAGGVAEEDLEAAARARRVGHCGKTRTSIPSALPIRRSSGVPPSRLRQLRRRLWPTKICVTPWSRAYARIVATG